MFTWILEVCLFACLIVMGNYKNQLFVVSVKMPFSFLVFSMDMTCMFLFLFAEQKRDYVSKPSNRLCLTSALKYKVYMTLTTKQEETFYYFWYPFFIYHLFIEQCVHSSVGTFSSIFLILICFIRRHEMINMCKWCYLVFPSVYSVLIYHWICKC